METRKIDSIDRSVRGLAESSKGEEIKMIRKVRQIPLFFSALGLIGVVAGIITNDWEGVIGGAFGAVCCFPDVFLIKHIRIRILHRFSVLAVVALEYYVSPGLLARIIMVILGAVALLDGIHLIARRRSLGESSAV